MRVEGKIVALVFSSFLLSGLLLSVWGCQKEQGITPQETINGQLGAPSGVGSNDEENLSNYVDGELIYVPIYSSVFSEAPNPYPLTATLNIHNIDLNHPIQLIKVDYYNTEGRLIRKYVESAVEIGSLQTVQFVVGESDTTGGTGANFLVEWVSGTSVNSPIVEALMISTSTQQGISFITSGRVVSRLGNAGGVTTDQ